jgi:hypothetical protein
MEMNGELTSDEKCKWTHLEDFEKPSDIQLCVQSQVVNICYECGDFFFKAVKNVFERCIRLVIVHIVIGTLIRTIVRRTCLVRFWVRGLGRRRFRRRRFLSDKFLDILLGIPYTAR